MTPRFRSLLLAAMALAAIAAAARASFRDRPPPGDFLRYERAATLAWRGQADLLYDEAARRTNAVWHDRENLPELPFRYSPALAVLLAPFGAMAPGTAWPLYAALTAALVVLGIGLSAAMAQRILPPGGPAWLPAAAALLPLLPFYLENAKLGQMNCYAFGLSLASLWAFDRGRDAAAGFLAAGAAVAKHMPVLLLFYFAWKRRWMAALWTLGALALLAYALPTVAIGPSRHHALLRQWAGQQDHLVTETGASADRATAGAAVHVEGQSVKAILYRYFTPTPFYHLSSKATEPGRNAASTGIMVSGDRHVDPRTLFGAWGIGVFLLLVAASVATMPPEGEDPRAGRRLFALEAGVLLAAMLLISPESRNPHFQMLAPAYAGLAALFAARRPGGKTGVATKVLAGAGALLVLLPTQGLVGRDAADHLLAHGAIGFGALLVMAALVVALLREAPPEQEPAAPAEGGGTA